MQGEPGPTVQKPSVNKITRMPAIFTNVHYEVFIGVNNAISKWNAFPRYGGPCANLLSGIRASASVAVCTNPPAMPPAV